MFCDITDMEGIHNVSRLQAALARSRASSLRREILFWVGVDYDVACCCFQTALVSHKHPKTCLSRGCIVNYCSIEVAAHKLYSSLSASHQKSVNCWEILARTRTGQKEEGWSGWWRAGSARLHFGRAVWEKQMGRIQRQPEEGEGREVRKQINRYCILEDT